MHRVILPQTGIFAAWREAARPLAAHGVPAAEVDWAFDDAEAPLLFDSAPLPSGPGRAVAVPRATYTGWNPRADGYAPGALCTNMGATVPFAATRAERDAAGDPRPSVEERTPTDAAYVAAVRAAADRLLAERLMLPDDAAASVQAAEAGTLARLGR